MHTRRHLLIVLVVAPFVPRALFAQSNQAPVVIGWLSRRSRKMDQRRLRPFKESLAELGWKEGEQFIIESRWADGQTDRLQTLADELVAKRPSIMVAIEGVATRAAAKASQNVPIVQLFGASPVGYGLAKTLAEPGGMITGLTNVPGELSKKYLELLLAAAPNIKRVGFLLDRRSLSFAGHMKNASEAVAHYRVDARFAELGRPEEIEPGIAVLAKEGVEGLAIVPSALFQTDHLRRRVVELALEHRWPVIAFSPAFAREGALLSYTADTDAFPSRAAWYVDRILKGAKPGDLPIEQPTKFKLLVNLKTAKMLGLRLPPEIMLRATQVFQ